MIRAPSVPSSVEVVVRRNLACLLCVSLFLLAGCSKKMVVSEASMPAPPPPPPSFSFHDLDSDYSRLAPNPRLVVADQPISTFSVDVDTGSYSRARRQLREGQRPDAFEVRTEEFLNYFDFGYAPPPDAQLPFSVTTRIGPAPWDATKHLLMVGIKGFEVSAADLPPANLVLLIDTSGSMAEPDKLPLLTQALRDFTPSLRAQDRVAIVAYAGSAGLVLPSTAGDRRGEIVDALERLDAGGSTAGEAGIALAYQVARENFIEGGINRVILATDGDFNVGAVSIDELRALIARQRQSGIALSTLGFGADGYRDAVSEQLADAGNGNYAFIDDELEARKVLHRELGSTLLTIASDVKVQVEFNPALVANYRLLGYENRMLAQEDFADDRVDAGEIGAGHDVTALYELTLASAGEARPSTRGATATAFGPDHFAQLRLRYKQPGAGTSQLIELPLTMADIKPADDRLRFAAAIAGFAEKLRGSEYLADYPVEDLVGLLDTVTLPDPHGERAELRDLIELAIVNPQP